MGQGLLTSDPQMPITALQCPVVPLASLGFPRSAAGSGADSKDTPWDTSHAPASSSPLCFYSPLFLFIPGVSYEGLPSAPKRWPCKQEVSEGSLKGYMLEACADVSPVYSWHSREIWAQLLELSNRTGSQLSLLQITVSVRPRPTTLP